MALNFSIKDIIRDIINEELILLRIITCLIFVTFLTSTKLQIC